MRLLKALAPLLALSLLAGCKTEQAPEPAPADAAAGSERFRDAPDFGGVQEVEVEATGIGGSPEEASLRALDLAISQVNGRRVTSGSAAAKSSLSIDINGLRALDAQSSAFADLIVSSSDGAVTGFQVVSSEEITKLQAEAELKASYASGGWLDGTEASLEASEKIYSSYWKVVVRAKVAKYEAPADDGRPKLLVAEPRLPSDRFAVGDDAVPAGEVAQAVKRRISESLSRSGRFLMLDRQLAPELQQEIEFINSGNARLADVARLGQQLATDLILVPTIERFEYRRHVRRLRMSDRELVSYSGGGIVGLDVINATTGEVVLARRFEYALPPTDASTLPRVVDGAAMSDQMMDALSEDMAKAVLSSIFPISVVALQGDVAVLSQGGQSVAVGETYEVVSLGDPLVDPQTGRSLGRMEIPCCRITVDRVAAQTAYGRLAGAIPAEGSFKPGMLELREQVVAGPTTPAPASSAPPASAPAAVAERPAPAAPAKPAAPAEDPDW